MPDTDIRDFRSALERIKAELVILKENIVSIKDCIEASHLVTEDMVQALSEVLTRYQDQYAALMRAGDRISVTIGVDINEIESSIQLYEERQVSRQLREVILDYFRLTAEHARVRTSLEESKRRLMEKCLLPAADLSDEIRPYGIVVENARAPRELLPEDEYQLLVDALGTRLADASDQGSLTIDPDADLSAYLDGSCPFLTPISDDDQKEMPKHDDDERVGAGENGADRTSDSEAQSDEGSNDEQTDAAALWMDFQGYMDGVELRLPEEASGEGPCLDELNELIKEHEELPYVLSTLANEKLMLPFDSLDPGRYSFVPLPHLVDTLVEKGYVMHVELDYDGAAKSYLALTQKGWACFRNRDIHAALAEKITYFAVPDHVQECRWSNAAAYRAAVICDYMNAHKAKGCVAQVKDTSFVFAYADGIDGSNSMVSTGLFEKGSEIIDLAWLQTVAMCCKESDVSGIVILVKDAGDIEKINDELILPEDIRGLVRYSVIGRAADFFGGSGKLIAHDHKDVHAPEQKNEVNMGGSGNEIRRINPRSALKQSSKLPSKQEFELLLTRNSRVSGVVFNLLPKALMLTEEQMLAELNDGYDDEYIAKLHKLESKGYVCAFEHAGEVYYAASRLMADCINKEQLRRVYRKCYPKVGDLHAPLITGDAGFSVDEFQKYIDLSGLYWKHRFRVASNKALHSMLQSPIWDRVNHAYYQVLHRKDGGSRKLLLVGVDDFASRRVEVGKGIICIADQLPIPNSADADAYFCITDALYAWNGTQWVSMIDGAAVEMSADEAESVNSEAVGDEAETADGAVESPENGTCDDTRDDTVGRKDDEAEAKDIDGENSHGAEPEGGVDLDYILALDAPSIALHLLEKNILPESYDEYYLLVEKLIEQNTIIMSDDRVVNTISQAVALMKALAQTDSEYEIGYQRLLMAVDSKIQPHAYTGSVLNTLFSNDAVGAFNHPVLKLMSYVRAMFAHDTAYDYELNSTTKGAFERFEDSFPGLEILKPLYNSLLKVRKYLPSGFAMPILRRFGDEKAQKEQAEQIQQRAKEFVSIPTVKSGLKAMSPMLNRCFGPESDLSMCMSAVASNDTSVRNVVKDVFAEFCEPDGSGELVLSETRINEMFDENWKKAIEEIHGPRTPILSQKNKILDNIRERLELMDQWMQITCTDDTMMGNWSQIQSLRAEIMAELERIEHELTGKNCTFENTIILAGIRGIRRKLQGRFVAETDEFVDLLRTGIFCLDERGIPHMDGDYVNVRYYEPWRNMLKHIAAPVVGLRTVLKGISDSSNVELFDNLGQAIQICTYLNANGDTRAVPETYILDVERGKRKAQSDADKFKGELEMAFAYGRITEEFKEDIQGILEHAVESFCDFNNFACLRILIDALRRMIDDEASSAVERLTREIDDRMAKQPDEKLKKMLEIARMKLNAPERNYAVAEEYINRFDAGVSDDLGLSEAEASNAFLRFVNEESEQLYRFCNNNSNNALKRFGVDYVTRNLEKKHMSAQYRDSALALIQNMPNRPDEIRDGENIGNLLREIGFNVVGVHKTHGATSGNQMVRLAVDVKPDAKDKSEYAHPVDIMGTKLESPLDVVCLFGKMQPNDIVDKVCKLELNKTAIVLLNGPFNVASRRQMAERFHREKSGRNPFLLIDWVLLLYLAVHQRTERMAVMLSCTLPYTSSFKPFVIKGTVPDEMFIGRKLELNRILDPNGPSIVYGGRQLGKTALLERALSLANHPERSEFAVLVRAASYHTEAELVSALIYELNAHKLGISNAILTMRELCMSLRKKHQEGKWTRILAMVDEADTILNNFRAMNPAYKPIIPLSDLCRETGNSFKFVLAGLHNVCRAATDPNTIFGQLGGALCIKPLNASDAYELLSRPLRYMGFRIAPDKLEHILVNTSFYPGIIHHVGYSLVENLSTRYTEYYSAARGNPPYELTDKQLGEIMSGDALNERINERIRWTLDVDPRYFMLARCIAYLDCEDPGEKNRSHTVESIMEYAELLEISSLAGLKKAEFEGLLKELVEMGILVSQNDSSTYRLRQRRFLEAIGNTCEKIESDIRAAEGV